MENVVWFKDVDRADIAAVGGKGANLGELVKIGAPVPNGFIVTSQAYVDSVKTSGAIDRVRGILYNLNPDDPLDLDSKAKQAQEEIKKIAISRELEREINNFYKHLVDHDGGLVAVRSSATAEDLPQASFAGQQSTFLNVKGTKKLKEAILAAWASLFEARAIFYRSQKKFDHFKVGIAIPVQTMVQSQASGVMFTIDPVTSNKQVITIEAIYGLGELIVGGQITPDHYEIAKKDYRILSKNIVSQEKQLVRAKSTNKIIAVSKHYRKRQKLSDQKIIELAQVGHSIEKHYFHPQDIEWALENEKLYIVQTRPVTTIKNPPKKEETIQGSVQKKGIIIVSGAPASPVIATGRVVIIKNPQELAKVQKGDVLVTAMTNPDFVPAMKRAVAIVTDRGGRTSHAAIVSRELGIACVVGTEKATRLLKDGMIVTVDGASGKVYKGMTSASQKTLLVSPSQLSRGVHLKTATKLYVNLAQTGLASQIASKNVDGVGLLRAEFILAQIGTHPKKFLSEKRSEVFVSKLASNLTIFAKAFGKRPVLYRASDLKSNEYKNLKGGAEFEPQEENPMLGYRGAYRYIKDPDVFKLELQAITRVRAKYKNLHLMIPFVRTVGELKTVRQIVEEVGLFSDRSFQFWMMVEIPTNVILLEDYLKVGLDGVSIGSNDLTMLILGTDRDNSEVAGEFYELDEAVLWALERTVKTCAKNNVAVSICGQAPSVYPELTEKLVAWGISSISVNPDAIANTREIIYQAEKKLLR